MFFYAGVFFSSTRSPVINADGVVGANIPRWYVQLKGLHCIASDTFGKSNGHFKPHRNLALHNHTNTIWSKFKRQRGKICFSWIGFSVKENTFMQFRGSNLSPKYAQLVHRTEYVCNVPPVYTLRWQETAKCFITEGENWKVVKKE